MEKGWLTSIDKIAKLAAKVGIDLYCVFDMIGQRRAVLCQS